MTEVYKIREAVNKVNAELLLPKSYSTRTRVYLMKPEGDWLRTGQTVILYHLGSELLGATGGCEDTQLQQLQKKIRQIQGETQTLKEHIYRVILGTREMDSESCQAAVLPVNSISYCHCWGQSSGLDELLA